MNNLLKALLSDAAVRFYTFVGIIVTLLLNKISPDLEEWGWARELFIFRKFLPEALLLLFGLIAWNYRSKWLSPTLASLRALYKHLSTRANTGLYSFLVIFLVGSSLFGGYRYAKARYALFANDTIQSEFRKLQLERATKLEEQYQFAKAGKIYEALVKAYPTEIANSSIEARLQVIKGLHDYSERLTELHEQAISVGDNRRAFSLLIEKVRINPWDENAEAKLKEQTHKLNSIIASMREFDQDCRAGKEPSLHKFENVINVAIEPYALRNLKSSKDVCDLLLRFPDTESSSAYIESTWEMPRAASMLKFIQDVHQGNTMEQLFPSSKKQFYDSSLFS